MTLVLTMVLLYGLMHAGPAHCLYIYSRTEWGGNGMAANMSDLLPPVHTITIHQTGGATCKEVRNTKNSCRVRLLSIRSQNKKTGFVDIAYNFLIAHDKVFQGRGWHKRASSKIGVHALDIAFVGTFLVTSPPEDYLNSARDLIGKGIKEGFISKGYTLVVYKKAQCTYKPQDSCAFKIIPEWAHFNMDAIKTKDELSESVRAVGGKDRMVPYSQTLVRGKSQQKYNANLTEIINRYDGPAIDFLESEALATLLDLRIIKNLTVADLDRASPQLFTKLPDAKKLVVTRQTMEFLSNSEQGSEIEKQFARKGCSFLRSLSVNTLRLPGNVPLSLALNMCECSKYGSMDIPAKMAKLCDIIESEIRSFQHFADLALDMCSICFATLLQRNRDWQEQVVMDTEMLTLACTKVGSSATLHPTVLSFWAEACPDPRNQSEQVRECSKFQPAFLAYRGWLPSPSELVPCRHFLCHSLCSLTEAEIEVITRVIRTNRSEDLGCLAYLDESIHEKTQGFFPVSSSSISGSCRMRSLVIKRARGALHRDIKACTVTCSEVKQDVAVGIDPPDVLDTWRIEACLGETDFSVCVAEHELGDYRWQRDQAKALLDIMKKEKSFSVAANPKILGFIGLALTPDALDNMTGLTNEIYNVFGAVYGWSPQQLRALSLRYLRDHHISPRQLSQIHLARLNHLICGLAPAEVREIPLAGIEQTLAILGGMQRCDAGVLRVLAQRVVRRQGEVHTWNEENFSQFGILLDVTSHHLFRPAGLSGEQLSSVGTALVDHVTVAVVRHIPPAEFRKLSVEQISLFGYDIALAASKRGLCPWLDGSQRTGYLQYLCSDGSSTLPLYILVLLSAVAGATVRSPTT